MVSDANAVVMIPSRGDRTVHKGDLIQLEHLVRAGDQTARTFLSNEAPVHRALPVRDAFP
jgi:hypothetical protein